MLFGVKLVKKILMDQEAGTDIAIAILGFLAVDARRLEDFFTTTGTNPRDVGSLARTRPFQLALLDYILADETLLLIFSTHSGIDPAIIAPARHALGAN